MARSGESGGRREAVNGINTYYRKQRKTFPEGGSNVFLRNILTSITTAIFK